MENGLYSPIHDRIKLFKMTLHYKSLDNVSSLYINKSLDNVSSLYINNVVET